MQNIKAEQMKMTDYKPHILMALSLLGAFWKLSHQSSKQTLWTRHTHQLPVVQTYIICVLIPKLLVLQLFIHLLSSVTSYRVWRDWLPVLVINQPTRFPLEGGLINSSFSLKTWLALLLGAQCDKPGCLLFACLEGNRCHLATSPFPAVFVQDCSK